MFLSLDRGMDYIMLEDWKVETTIVVVTNGDPPFQKFTGSSIRSKDQNQVWKESQDNDDHLPIIKENSNKISSKTFFFLLV